jgi:hypothetical protein
VTIGVEENIAFNPPAQHAAELIGAGGQARCIAPRRDKLASVAERVAVRSSRRSAVPAFSE